MKITVVVGKLCSGKSTYTSVQKNENIIEIGEIVRQLTSIESRVFDSKLDTEINNKLFQRISYSFYHNPQDLYVVGIRQSSILENLELICKDLGIEVEIIYLKVPDKIRKQRYIKRKENNNKDSYLTFEMADKYDMDLGLRNLIEELENKKHIKIKNY